MRTKRKEAATHLIFSLQSSCSDICSRLSTATLNTSDAALKGSESRIPAASHSFSLNKYCWVPGGGGGCQRSGTRPLTLHCSLCVKRLWFTGTSPTPAQAACCSKSPNISSDRKHRRVFIKVKRRNPAEDLAGSSPSFKENSRVTSLSLV